jgi:hypothetical protein
VYSGACSSSSGDGAMPASTVQCLLSALLLPRW